jgi:hypothetical protein
LTLRGIYLARLHLGSLGSLVSTPYGRILLAKLAIVAAMGALGGYHHVVVHRRILQSLAGPDAGSDLISGRFHRTLQLEALLGGLALGVATFLGSTSPPHVERAATADPFRQEHQMGDAKLALDIWPLRAGLNTIHLRVTDRIDQPLGDALTGLLQLAPSDVEMGPLAVTLDRESAGMFVKTGVLLGVEGHWRGRLTVQRQGAFDLHDRFEFVLPAAASQPTHDALSSPLDGVMGLIALGIVGVTVLLFMTSRRQLHLALRRLAHAHQAPANHPEGG